MGMTTSPPLPRTTTHHYFFVLLSHYLMKVRGGLGSVSLVGLWGGITDGLDWFAQYENARMAHPFPREGETHE